VIEVADVLVRDHLRVVGQVVQAVHDREDEVAALAQDVEPLGARLRREHRVEDLDQRSAVAGAHAHRREARVGLELRAPDRAKSAQ
jgi:hypothetical protein